MNDHSTQLFSPSASQSANQDVSVEIPTVRASLEDATQPAPVRADAELFVTQIGKFRVVRLLGRGGQASAYEAFDPDLQRSVVLKVYDSAESAEEQETVLREGQSLARVRSPYVAQCHGAERHGKTPFLIVEHVSGETLSERIRREPPTLVQALEWMNHLAEGVAAIHACGLLHRDLKPSNILIDQEGRPRIIDFGLATAVGDLESQVISGTPAYMAPEVARGESQRIDARADVFGLGAVFYELLTGRPPYAGKEPVEIWKLAREGRVTPVQEVRANVPAPIAKLCMDCLTPTPDLRLESAAKLADCLAGRVAELRRPATKGLSWTLRLGRFRIRLALGVSLATILLILGVFQFERFSAPEGRDVAVAPGSHVTEMPAGNSFEAMAGPQTPPAMGLDTKADEPTATDVGSHSTKSKNSPGPSAANRDADLKRSVDPHTIPNRKAGEFDPPRSVADSLPDQDPEALARSSNSLRGVSLDSLRVELRTGEQSTNGIWHVARHVRLKMRVTAKRDCQAALYLEREDGSITQLVPNNVGDSGTLAAGQVATWPSAESPLPATRSPWDASDKSNLHLVVREPEWKPDLDWGDGSFVEYRSTEQVERWHKELLKHRLGEYRLIPVHVDLP